MHFKIEYQIALTFTFMMVELTTTDATKLLSEKRA